MEGTPTTTTVDKATPAVEAQVKEEKKNFTQEDIDRIINDRLNRERETAKDREAKAVADALAEAERKAKLTAEQRAAEESQKREQELQKREQEISLRENRVEACGILQEKGISISLADFVIDVDPEKTRENIKTLEKAWAKAVEQGIADKMKGTTPTEKKADTTTRRGIRGIRAL